MSEAGAGSPRGHDASPDDGTPPGGSLEELDGSPIGATVGPPPAAPAIPWRRGFAGATALTARRPRLWAFALVAFLARGGLAVLALPIVIGPTFVGLANFVGPASVSAEGPGPRLVALIAAGLTTALGLAVAGTLVAAAAEVALHGATIEGAGAVAAATDTRRAVARVAALRLLLLVPVAAVAVIAVPAWIAVAYRELTLPSDVAVPLVARVLAGARLASVAVLGAWLAAEVVGGFAARRAALLGTSVAGSLAGGLLDPFRAPLGTTLTVAAALAGTVLVLAPGLWAVGFAWEIALVALGGASDAVAGLGAALLLAAAWGAVLVLAGITAAWRASLFTMEVLRRAP